MDSDSITEDIILQHELTELVFYGWPVSQFYLFSFAGRAENSSVKHFFAFDSTQAL
jgi:hypothetical protein